MVFSSITFLFFFLPLFLILYYLLPFKNILLLLFSLIFYAWGEPVYIILLIISSITDFTIGKLIETKDKKKLFLTISIVINLLLLGFFKYGDFLIENINSLFNISIPLLKLGLPIGISFFTFQTMSYSIDVYRGKVKAERNFLTFLTYVCMFPQLIAGPIVRYEDVSEELHNRRITLKGFNDGFRTFLNGLFKKVLIANNVGYLFSLISTLPIGEISVLSAWLAIICFTLQIYFDFSGYSDMAIGIGKMLGFNYPKNFDYPFVAKSITEFWRRWHITLSSWFKDYVYIPLGGNKSNVIRNLLLVWLLTGLWHGASWNFVIWGLYFGVLLILEKFVFKKYLDKVPNIIRHIVTMFLVIISFYIFAFDDFSLLTSFGSILFGFSGNVFIDDTFKFYLTNYGFVILVGCLLSVPILKERVKMNWFMVIIYIVLFVMTVAFLVSDSYNPFLYFRF